MRIGARRHRVTFQRPIEKKSDIGAVTYDWQTIKTVWASVRPISSFEKFNTDQFISGLDSIINTRYCHALCNVTAKDRVLFNDKKYNINGEPINKFERNKELEIPVRLIVGKEAY